MGEGVGGSGVKESKQASRRRRPPWWNEEMRAWRRLWEAEGVEHDFVGGQMRAATKVAMRVQRGCGGGDILAVERCMTIAISM